MRKFLIEISNKDMERALQNLLDEDINIPGNGAEIIGGLLAESFFDNTYSMFKVTEICSNG